METLHPLAQWLVNTAITCSLAFAIGYGMCALFYRIYKQRIDNLLS